MSKDRVPPKFCFEASAWDRCVTRVFELQQVFRQADPVFQRFLASVRRGQMTEEVLRILEARHRVQYHRDDGIEATVLVRARVYPHLWRHTHE